MKDLDIKKCLDGRVEAGALSREAAESALKMIRDLERKYAADRSPEVALSSAISETARIMKEAAERKKVQTALQVLRSTAVLDEARAHPNSIALGGIAQLERIENQREVIQGQLFRRFAAGLEAYRSKYTGFVQDTVGMRNFIREVFEQPTGDPVAAVAARGWKDAIDHASKRFISGGGDLAELETWRVPQMTEADRLRPEWWRQWSPAAYQRRKAELKGQWLEHMTQAARRGDLRVLDFETGEPATGLKLADILEASYRNVIKESQGAAGAGGHNERRVFHWQNADAWLAYQDQWGVGRSGLFQVLTGHLDNMARDISLTEGLGPKHSATSRALVQEAAAQEAERMPVANLNPANLVSNSNALDRMYRVMAGQTSAVENEFMASVFGGLRNWISSAKLGSSTLAAVPSDAAVSLFAAKWNGIPATRLLWDTAKQMRGGENRAAALRLGIASAAVTDAALGAKRYADQIVGSGLSARFGTWVLRANGMLPWTRAIKTATMHAYMGEIADNVGRSLSQVSKPLQRMLKRHGIESAEWDAIRALPLLDHEGARWFDPGQLEGAGSAGEKLMAAIIAERKMGVIEPGARIQQLTTGGAARGTWSGDLSRSFWHLKSFSLAMSLTHLQRAAFDSTWRGKLAYVGIFVPTLMVAGAFGMQMRQIITGKDPRRMDDWAFWGAAFMAGGAAGVYGDFLYSATGRTDSNVLVTAAGPSVGVVNDVVRLASPDLRRLYDGKPSKFGAELARFVRYNLPGGNLWYSRLVTDRAVMDNIQALLDPQYRESFSRMEERARKDYGQRFWWRPGQSAPDRAPDLGVMGPR